MRIGYVYILIDLPLPDATDLIEVMENRLKYFVEFRICDCGKIIEGDQDICDRCYAYECENEENCPICLENGSGTWINFKACECKCWYHISCVKTVSLCPTCRKPINYNWSGFNYK